jgi:hypothetical protein
MEGAVGQTTPPQANPFPVRTLRLQCKFTETHASEITFNIDLTTGKATDNVGHSYKVTFGDTDIDLDEVRNAPPFPWKESTLSLARYTIDRYTKEITQWKPNSTVELNVGSCSS